MVFLNVAMNVHHDDGPQNTERARASQGNQGRTLKAQGGPTKLRRAEMNHPPSLFLPSTTHLYAESHF